MNDWKELKIDNLPPDILTGEYEFMSDQEFNTNIGYRCNILIDAVNGQTIMYRKPEPKAPSHEEIMTLWWEVQEDTWAQIETYNTSTNRSQENPMYIFNGPADGARQIPEYERYSVDKAWFSGRKSATIPPETV